MSYRIDVLGSGAVTVSREEISLSSPESGGTVEKKAVKRSAALNRSRDRLNRFAARLEPYRPRANGMVTETCERTPLDGTGDRTRPDTRREVKIADQPTVFSRVPVWTVRWKRNGYEAHFQACQNQRGHRAIDAIYSAIRALGLPDWARWPN